MPLTGHGLSSLLLRRGASRPQLKRGPLGRTIVKAKVIAKVLLATTLVSEFTVGIGLAISLFSRAKRIWPPPGKHSWQQYYILVPTFTAMASAVPLGIFDWNSFIVHHWSRFLVGGAAAVAGLSFALWGTRSMSVHTSLGLEGKLVTTGAYRLLAKSSVCGIYGSVSRVRAALQFGYEFDCRYGGRATLPDHAVYRGALD